MSEQNENQTPAAPSELEMLKQRARLMGISHSNNISVEKLREKINEKLSSEKTQSDEHEEDDEDDIVGEAQANVPDHGLNATASLSAPSGAPGTAAEQQPAPMAPMSAARARPMTKAQRDQEIRVRLHRECMKLIRCRITNLNPTKKDLPGEIFVVGNKYLGTVKKFIPYGEATDDGYHIPKILYDELVARKFQQINVKKDKRTQTNIVQTRWVREFAIEVLPPLTEKELADLANAQLAAGSVDASADNSL